MLVRLESWVETVCPGTESCFQALLLLLLQLPCC